MRPIVLAIASVSHLACVERGGITMHAGSGSSPAIYEVAADSTSTQTCFNGAACCPAGSALRGVNLGTNPVTLDCRPTNEPFQDCFLDHSTNDPGSGMQMCPEGTYMRGVNPGAHNFVCCYDHHRGYTPFLSDQTMDASGALTSNWGTNFRMCENTTLGTRYLVGLDGDGSNRLLCRSPNPNAAPAPPAMAPNASLPGEVSGSSNVRSLQTYFPSGATAQSHQLWKKINRNWLSHVFHIPVQTWIGLNSNPIVDPPVPGWTVDFQTTVCHTPFPADPLVCTGGAAAGCADTDCIVPQQKIHYTSPVDGRLIYAYLFFPPTNPVTPPASVSRPVVLVTHGHKTADNSPIDNNPIGKDATGSAPWSAYHAAARELAAVAQAITIAPDARTWHESGIDSDCSHGLFGATTGSSGCHDSYADNHPIGWMPPGYALDNLINLTVALNTTVNGYHADRSRVFAGGLSLGGWQATWEGGLDPRITGGVIAAGSFLDFVPPSSIAASDSCQRIPGLSRDGSEDPAMNIFDTADFAALTAPGRYLTTWGRSDDNYSQTSRTTAWSNLTSVYTLLHTHSLLAPEDDFWGQHEWDIYIGSPINQFVAASCTPGCGPGQCNGYDGCGNVCPDTCPNSFGPQYSCVPTGGSCQCSTGSCAAQGKNCGTISDGCGNTIGCGTCSGFQTCGGGGVPNVCGCTPRSCGRGYIWDSDVCGCVCARC